MPGALTLPLKLPLEGTHVVVQCPQAVAAHPATNTITPLYAAAVAASTVMVTGRFCKVGILLVFCCLAAGPEPSVLGLRFWDIYVDAKTPGKSKWSKPALVFDRPLCPRGVGLCLYSYGAAPRLGGPILSQTSRCRC